MSGPLQWTPRGMVPIPPYTGTAQQAPIPFDDVGPGDEENDEEREPEPVAARATATRKPAAPAKPINVLRLARERLKVVRAELRRMRTLEREEAELSRLLKAAKEKPRAIVRELPKRSAG